jgi:hypothetical protein
MVNPKRPISKDKVIPGLMPYNPLLPPAPKQMLNYNLTVRALPTPLPPRLILYLLTVPDGP